MGLSDGDWDRFGGEVSREGLGDVAAELSVPARVAEESFVALSSSAGFPPFVADASAAALALALDDAPFAFGHLAKPPWTAFA